MQTRRCTRLPGITLAVLLTLVVGQGLGFADDDGNRPPKCTLATLKGRYLFGGIATLLDPEEPDPLVKQQLLAVAGYHIFNGDGTGTDIVTATVNGVIVEENAVYPITYSVKENCSGTYEVPSAGLTTGIFIAPNGAELIVIGTNKGSVLVQGPNRRVSDK